ncbi:hypothetical protein FJZ31_40395 [Candidatus Poribacteria bacterium]|nr:hypothetical protein [Candidatus Poribacteria bacterium]
MGDLIASLLATTPKQIFKSSIVGVRIFFTHFLTADIGVRYQQNFDTIADAKVEANIGLSIPTHLVSRW